MKNIIWILFLILLVPASALAQSAGFNFQGRLNDGTSPANGRYDLQFRLFDAVVGGNQIGSPSARPNTTLINGVFSVMLDFGATAFDSPNNVFVEIGVRPNGSPNAYTILGPRQQLTVAPIALRAVTATNADFATNAQNAINSANAEHADDSARLGGQLASEYIIRGQGDGEYIRNLQGGGSQPNARISIAGDGHFGGELTVGLDARQSINMSGLVKAMVFVNANGTIRRCFNGIYASSPDTCGFVVNRVSVGDYHVTFGFQVGDRFASVTPIRAPLVTVVASIRDPGALDREFEVFINVSDVDHVDSPADNPFTIVVY